MSGSSTNDVPFNDDNTKESEERLLMLDDILATARGAGFAVLAHFTCTKCGLEQQVLTENSEVFPCMVCGHHNASPVPRMRVRGEINEDVLMDEITERIKAIPYIDESVVEYLRMQGHDVKSLCVSYASHIVRHTLQTIVARVEHRCRAGEGGGIERDDLGGGA